MELQMPQFQWTISLNGLLIASAILMAAWKLSMLVRMLISPIRDFVDEHNVLWEDYSIRTGGKYRRAIGRGGAIDPEEFYRHHAADVKSEVEDLKSD